MILDLKLLGTPTAFHDGEPVQGFISVKSRALLFYLAMKPGVHGRQTLAALLWPETTETGAAKNLRNILSNLRKLVGTHLEITRQTASFRRDSAYYLDVEQFSALLERYRRGKEDITVLEKAVLLYAGDFLDGFHVPDSEIYEAWLTSEREQLRQAQLETLRTLATWYTDRADYRAGMDYVSRLLTLDNYCETGQQLKMTLLAQNGRRIEALAQYTAFRRLLNEELGVVPTAATSALYKQIKEGELDQQPAAGSDDDPVKPPAQIDWGDIPGETLFYGRYDQLKTLQQRLNDGQCRLITITGIGGVGKTALAARLARWLAQPPQSYDFIIWRSLANAPPLTAVLNSWLVTLSGQQLTEMPETVDEQLALLLTYLREKRCLLVLDNFETVLEAGVRAGQYQTGYEEYEQLIQRAGGGHHQSCLLITSREPPQGLRRVDKGIRQSSVMNLPGLADETGTTMLRALGIRGVDETLSALVRRYSGNPLALKLAADTAQTLFGGNIDLLLEETAVFGDIRDVLDEQFSRLTPLENEILTWLAVEREPVTTQTIWDNLARPPHKRQFLDALRSLNSRSLLEQAAHAGKIGTKSAPHYTLQNVVMEYAASRLIESICQEIEAGEVNMMQQVALVRAYAKEYVQASQRRLLLQPVARWLIKRLGAVGASAKLRDLLETVRANPSLLPGYAGANILHLLAALGEDLGGTDFSRLVIRQADLRDVILHNVSFKGCDLSGTVFRDTFGIVTAIAFSPDGQLLAASASDGSISLWRLHEYQPYLVLRRSTGHDLSISFSPDGQLLAGGGMDNVIRIWDLSSGKQTGQLLAHSDQVTAVVFSPDGKTLYSGGEDQTIGIWDVEDRQLLRQIPNPGNVILTLAVSPNGKIVAGGGYDGAVYLWKTQSGMLNHQMGEGEKIRSIAFSPDGSTLAAAVEDNEIHLWHVHDGEKQGTLFGHANFVLSVAFHPDGATLASGSFDKTIRLWDIGQGHTKRVIHNSANWITCVAFSPDGAILAGGGYDQRIRLWHSHSGQLLHTLRGTLFSINLVVYSPDGRLLASASYDRPVQLWDTQDGTLLHTFQRHNSTVRRLAFTPDSRTLAVSGDEYKIRLWDTETGQLQRTLTVDKNVVRTLAFNPDGNLLAAGVGSEYGTLWVWDVETSRLCFKTVDIRTGLEFHFCFSPDGQFLAYSDRDHVLKIMNIHDEVICGAVTDHKSPIEVIRFSTDGSLMVTLDRDGTLFVWQVAADGSATRHAGFQGSGSNADLWNLAFSPDNKTIAFQLDGGSLGIFDVNGGKLRCSVEESFYGDGNLAFSRDSALLMTGSVDGTIHLWNAATGEQVRALTGHEGMVRAMNVNYASGRIASGDDDGVIRIWDIQTGECDLTLAPPGPYEGLDINGAIGLSPAQIESLKALGAVA